MTNYNAEIESILARLNVPFSFLHYEGKANIFITYMQIDKDNSFAGDDEIISIVQNYDFDIYSKGNYLTIVDQLINLMVEAGWTYQPSRDSPDMYEADTKFYHKTICFAKESEV